ncbi:non-heme iron oxygenase ferredoxin subunit [uncultured Boseongicola sp.]|jgi:nitrite reductase/ring-hydroxylating ferredoxin subunit|uniref:non-heme iron oxygenase ferredoxin subunit n=1 Tax=uncultured Boseongicola sp. TaxID=1648499 RepID=UPI002636EBAF|nr:non-heme iron oxygenase ferredoxin subunit [uncultured Boseongicola sp.]
MTEANNQIEICAKDDVPDGEVIRVDHGDLELAVYQVEGTFYVTDNACTHGPGELSEGYLEGHVIECDFHQGKFDIRDGEVVAPPCLVAIKTYKILPHETAVVIEAP